MSVAKNEQADFYAHLADWRAAAEAYNASRGSTPHPGDVPESPRFTIAQAAQMKQPDPDMAMPSAAMGQDKPTVAQRYGNFNSSDQEQGLVARAIKGFK